MDKKQKADKAFRTYMKKAERRSKKIEKLEKRKGVVVFDDKEHDYLAQYYKKIGKIYRKKLDTENNNGRNQ